MAATGEVLQDRYELRSLIATGGMGEVWRAQDRVLGREVAVKVLKSQFTGDPVFLTRLRTEARLSAGLTHPNIAVLHDYGEVEPATPVATGWSTWSWSWWTASRCRRCWRARGG